MTFGFAMLREVLVKALLVGVVSSATVGLGYLLDVALAAVGRGEPRAARLRREHAHDRRLAGGPQAGAAARKAALSRPDWVQMTSSRPGPTPIRATGTPTNSET